MGGLEVITIVTNYSIANLQLIDISVITKLLVDRGDILTSIMYYLDQWEVVDIRIFWFQKPVL